jgi:hypothetical protein
MSGNILGGKLLDRKFAVCCHKGKIKLDKRQPIPQLFRDLMTNAAVTSYTHFRDNGTFCNNCFS